MFKRPASYFAKRFFFEQESCWLAWKAGRDLFLDCGRRSGKSELFAELLIEAVEEYERDALYIAVTRIEAREIMWDKLSERLKDRPNWTSNETRLEWTFHGKSRNGTIYLKGADKGAKALRGTAKKLILCDEVAFWDHPDVVEMELIPMLADYNGQIGFASTPKGKNHYWDRRNKIANDSRFFHGHWTMYQNPYLSDDGRKRVASAYLGVNDPYYRQEILGEYVQFSGLVFALDERLFTGEMWHTAELYHSWHYQGVDHGYSPDPTAAVWLAYNPLKDHVLVYSEYKQDRLLVSQHAESLLNQEPYRMQQRISDIDPQLIAEYDAMGVPLEKAGKYDREARLVRLVNALRTGKLKIAPNCRQLLQEMRTLEWKQDGDDHLVDALLYVYTNMVFPTRPEKAPTTDPRRAGDHLTTGTRNKFTPHFGQDFGDED